MNAASIHGVVAQICAAIMWGSDIAGHPAVGTIFHDPAVANNVTAVVAGLFFIYGTLHHAYAVWFAKGVLK